LLRRGSLAAVAVSIASFGVALSVGAPAAHAVADCGEAWIVDTEQMSMDSAASASGAEWMYLNFKTGKGVGIAMIDTGVAPVKGLTSGNVVNGPDLSFESQDATTRHVDGFGHGTHLAGIIAGRDDAAGTKGTFRGIAYNSKLTSIKVGVSNGAVDVTQTIAALDWVVAHKNDDPANPIRVVNIAYGTDGVQDYTIDPLAHAVENAWRAGIVVVTAAGNYGTNRPKLNNPATDPYVIAIGAADFQTTSARTDDTVSPFSSRGDTGRRVDLLAPGRSILSLRAPGSFIDSKFPTAQVGDRFFKGSGTSQAAAIVAGGVALLLEERPKLTPDQVKKILMDGATKLAVPTQDLSAMGAGELSLKDSSRKTAPKYVQTWAKSTGTGTLEGARGSNHVVDDGVSLTGENDIFGPFNTRDWAAKSTARTSWIGGAWMGRDWTGSAWGAPVNGLASWSGRAWSGRAWSGRAWSDVVWSGRAWSTGDWSGTEWSAALWS
jgi:serine protease AprX